MSSCLFARMAGRLKSSVEEALRNDREYMQALEMSIYTSAVWALEQFLPTNSSALGMILGIKVPVNDYWIGGVVSKLASAAPVSGDVLHGVLDVLAWGVASMIAGTALFRKMDVK